MTKKEKPESEFGQGYGYCLGLFLPHAEMAGEFQKTEKIIGSVKTMASLWFSAAADHLYDLVIPMSLPKKRQKEISEWRNKCVAFRLCMGGEKCDWDDVGAAIQFAKDALREWDKLNGVETIKGRWE